jgi:hypothetical protein
MVQNREFTRVQAKQNQRQHQTISKGKFYNKNIDFFVCTLERKVLQ